MFRAKRGGPRTRSRRSDANPNWEIVENVLVFVVSKKRGPGLPDVINTKKSAVFRCKNSALLCKSEVAKRSWTSIINVKEFEVLKNWKMHLRLLFWLGYKDCTAKKDVKSIVGAKLVRPGRYQSRV